MVPIYDSDVAEERWSRSEWGHYELWEKVEQRARRHNRLWIACTVVVFLALSSVPILMDRSSKWATLSSVRRLGQEINHMKREAAIEHAAYRIRFAGNGSLEYRIERVESCSDPESSGTLLGKHVLIPGSGYVLLSPDHGESLGIPGLLEEFCYDPLRGSMANREGDTVSGFGVIPAADLGSGRLDRMSLLVLGGPSAEVSFE